MSEIDREPLWNATVVRREDANERVARVWIAPDSGAVSPFEPGQFVQVGWPKDPEPDAPPGGRVRWIKRSYSIASAPGESPAYELFLALVPEGLLTPRLWRLEQGSRTWCDDKPKGLFTLERIPAGQHLVMVATGTGVAPFVSMLRHYRGRGRWRRLTIVHGARTRSDLVYDEELTAAAGSDASFRYLPVLSREPESGAWRGLRGRVQSALADDVFARSVGEPLGPKGTHVLLCGNPAMIEDVRALLAPAGFALDTAKVPGNLHFERYW